MLRSEFYALMLMALMVLHNAEGQEIEDAMAEVANRAQADAYLSPQMCRRSGPDFDCRTSTCRGPEAKLRDAVCGACVSAVPDEECDAEHISPAIF